jgi:hypothetical protein
VSIGEIERVLMRTTPVLELAVNSSAKNLETRIVELIEFVPHFKLAIALVTIQNHECVG